MEKYTYYPQGTCSTQIDVTLNGDIIDDVTFYNGCHGNTQGISCLVRGMKAEEVIKRLEGIRCGYKNTSCPDQLARALRETLAASQQSRLH